MSSEPGPFVYEFGEWIVEPSLNRLGHDGDLVHVEPRTLAVLTYLLDRPGRLVSIDEMLDQVWTGRVVEPNAIHRHIARIRHLLRDDPHNPRYVETISKRGYRAIAPVCRKLYALEREDPAREVDGANPLRGDNGSPDNLPNSIAVLPLENLSPNHDDAYFAAGIHEELVHRLGNIESLFVIARAATAQYADSRKSASEIGRELNVATVMCGCVRYAGKRVRITVQLIDVASGSQLWSQAFEENLEDVFAIQQAIALRVALTLQAEFSAAERERVGRRLTRNAEAYAHYLHAISEWGNLTASVPVEESLNAAISLDPEFSAAMGFKAFIRAATAGFGSQFYGREFNVDVQQRLIRSAEQLARRALAIDENEARAKYALGFVHTCHRRWKTAQECYERVFLLDPNDYMAVHQGAISALMRGDLHTATKLMERSISLNPADAANVWAFGDALYWHEHWEAASEMANLTITLIPQSPLGYAQLARTSSRASDADAVRRNAALAEARNPQLTELVSIARAYGQIGDVDEARRIFDLACAGDAASVTDLRLRFWLHMAVKDFDTAIQCLDRSIQTNFPFLITCDFHKYHRHPDFDPIRTHPRFNALLQQIEIPLAAEV